MTDRIISMEIKKTMDEVVNTRSWRKIGKAMKLYSLCTNHAIVNPYESIVR